MIAIMAFNMRPTMGSPHITVQTTKPMNTLYFLLFDHFKVLPANILPVGVERFKIFVTRDEQLQLTADSNITALSRLNIKVLLNSDQTAHRSVIIAHLDAIELAEKDETLKATIQQRNRVHVSEIIRLPTDPPALKIQLSTQRDCDKLLADGLLLKYTKLNNYHLSRERPSKRPIICSRCYKVNDHLTSSCKSTTLVCSLCAENGHRYTNCTNPQFKCINCAGEHCTMSLSCSRLKEADKFIPVNRKANTTIQSDSSRRSYAMATSSKLPRKNTPVSDQWRTTQVPNLDTVESTTMISIDKAKAGALVEVISHLYDPKTQLSDYIKALNLTFQENNLPTIRLPRTIIDKFSEPQAQNLTAASNDSQKTPSDLATEIMDDAPLPGKAPLKRKKQYTSKSSNEFETKDHQLEPAQAESCKISENVCIAIPVIKGYIMIDAAL